MLLATGGRIGVNVFILLTGYFSYQSDFKIKKVVQIILQVYSSVFMIFLISLFLKDQIWKQKVLLFLNPLGSGLWFVREYLFLLIISPYLNKIIQVLSCSKIRQLLILGFVVLSFTPSFIDLGFFQSNIFWFSYLYLLAGTYRKYSALGVSTKTKLVLLLALLLTAISYFAVTMIINVSSSIGIGEQNSIFIFSLSVFLFLFFELLPIKQSDSVNKIASLTFGIYLFHDFPIIRDELMSLIKLSRISQFSIIHAAAYIIISALPVFIFCAILEYLRKLIFGKIITVSTKKFFDYIES